MPVASVYLNGDPVDDGVLDNFVCEVKTRGSSLRAHVPG
jgi:hypothetical protein